MPESIAPMVDAMDRAVGRALAAAPVPTPGQVDEIADALLSMVDRQDERTAA